MRDLFSIIINRNATSGGERMESWKVVMNMGKPFDRLPSDSNIPLMARSHRAGQIELVKKTLFLFRLPGDALFSYYFFSHRDRELTDVDEFLSQAIGGWKEMAEAALAKHESAPTEVRVMSFERFKTDPVPACQGNVDFVGIEGREYVRKALMVLDNLFRNTSRSHPTPHQPRRGEIGGGKEFFNPNQIDRIETELMPYYERLRALEN